MKSLILTTLSLISLSAFAQTSNFIEIAVSETVQMKPKSVTVHLAIESINSQRRAFYREEFGRDEYDYEYDYEYYDEYSEEDYIYEEMMYENPKKVTKEMTKAYEERARKREERQKEIADREAAFQQKWEARHKLTYSELKAKMAELGFSAKVIKRSALDELYVDWDEEYYEDEYYGEESYGEEYSYSDSVVELVISNASDWDRLNAAIKELPVNKNVHDAEYNTLDDEFASVIPQLTEKAKSQAQIMATSMNRKLGKILSCSNIYPYTPSKNMMASYTRSIERMYRDRNLGDNPFESTKDEVIEYIYKFELL